MAGRLRRLLDHRVVQEATTALRYLARLHVCASYGSSCSALLARFSAARTFSPHEWAYVFEQVAVSTFLGLMVVLMAARRKVRGPHANPLQGLVALLGTFILNLVGFLPVELSTATENLVVSSVIVSLGTVFAIWSLATLGGCFGCSRRCAAWCCAVRIA